MPSHWREPLDPSRHRDWFHAGVGAWPRAAPEDPLIPAWSYFVRAAGFTFEFAETWQIAVARDWFGQKNRPSSAFPVRPMEHEWQHWYERLPKGLTREDRRLEILQALEAAIAEFGESEPHFDQAPHPEGLPRDLLLDYLKAQGVEFTFRSTAIICQRGPDLHAELPNKPFIPHSTCSRAAVDLRLDAFDLWSSISKSLKNQPADNPASTPYDSPDARPKPEHS